MNKVQHTPGVTVGYTAKNIGEVANFFDEMAKRAKERLQSSTGSVKDQYALRREMAIWERAATIVRSTTITGSAEDLVKALKLNTGQDGFLLAQMATFLGGLLDASKARGMTKEIGEGYVKMLMAMHDTNREALAKAEGN